MLHIIYFINASMSQTRKKKANLLFISVLVGKAISDFRQQMSLDSEYTCNTCYFFV